MRLIFCTTLLFLLALINESKSLAQENSFGLRGGINFSDLSNVDADKQQLGIGWNAGFRADIKLTKKVSILSEILYSRKGSVINFNYDFLGEQIAKGETILAFDYIDIPVYLAYHPTNKLSIYAGPYIGLMLEAKVDTQVEILNILNIESDEDIDLEYFNSKDFGVSAGISWKYNFIRLGASYFYGLAKISNDDDVSKSLIGDAKNRVFEVYVGVMF
ncbi:MAG: PorT family protein [Bacteroidales bacterium]|nr:PorT family protein [Bacteroidales bacterium]